MVGNGSSVKSFVRFVYLVVCLRVSVVKVEKTVATPAVTQVWSMQPMPLIPKKEQTNGKNG
jgi:hypothetical protein